MLIEHIIISDDRTHHLYNNKHIYDKKFFAVEKFHVPGLAPVVDESGAYHININGKEAYSKRYNQSFGFYCGLAAVDIGDKWFHIKSDGQKAYNEIYDWLGNFQEEKCVAKQGTNYLHIDKNGKPLYTERYSYVGDYKDGIAVAIKDGKSTHIDTKGNFVHGKWFDLLGNFHKGYACARDEIGWFHINLKGNQLYTERYQYLEPFYNKLALARTFDGKMIRLDLNQITSYEIISSNNKSNDFINEVFGDLVGFWRTKIISFAVSLDIFSAIAATGKLDNISASLSIPKKNLTRVLRAMWEMNLVKYDASTDSWNLAEKGNLFLDHKYDFLNSAAIMWDKVSHLNWGNLSSLVKQKEIASHDSFKDTASNEDKELYNKALNGYLKLDLKNIVENIIKLKNPQDILCIGKSSDCLAKALGQENIANVKAISTLEDLTDISTKNNYDSAILIKFIHYFDDIKAQGIFKQLSSMKVNSLFIIEMLIQKDSPSGGMLDINMLIETGGRLRSITDFTLMLNSYEYKLKQFTEINPFLHMIYAQK